MNVIAGIFVILHGLVHFWYFTLSRGWVEFQPEMGWNGQSWLLSGWMTDSARAFLATILYGVAAAAVVASGVGLLSQAGWTRPLLVTSAGISTAVIFIFWDGSPEMMVQKGLLGILINVGIIGATLLAA